MLANQLLELSAKVEDFCKIKSFSTIKPTIELSGDIKIPYVFKCEALHPGEYKGFTIEEMEIMKAKNTIFDSEGNFHNYEINKDHKSSRYEGTSVDDVIEKVVDAQYDLSKKAYILTGEIYDQATALKVANGIIKYVSLRINPQWIDETGTKRIARDLRFEELSLVRSPGDPNAKILG